MPGILETPVTLPSPPFVAIKGITNFRDLGGYPIANEPTKSIRRNYIYRSAEPSLADEQGISKLKSLGIKRIFDLRRDAEIAKEQSNYDFPGIERVSTPTADSLNEEASQEHQIAHFKSLVSDDPNVRAYLFKPALDSGYIGYGNLVRGLLKSPPSETAVLIHCTGGKERTGRICALLLSLCGVSDEVIAEEYVKSNLGLESFFEERVKMHMEKHGVGEEDAKNISVCRKEIMLDTLPMIRKEYGGAEGYFRNKCGLSEVELDQLKSYLIVDEKPILP